VTPSRFEDILRGLDFCIAHAETEEGITLGSVMDHLGTASFCFVSLLLATPFLQPMSLGPLTMASGGVFMIVGWQMARGREHVSLPNKVQAWHLRGTGWVRILKLCRKILLWLTKFTSPRLNAWIDGPRGTQNIGWLILIGGFLLAIPSANLPFNNTLPALMIFFSAVAWLEKDGLMALIALFWGAATVLYFALTATFIILLGGKAWTWITSFFT
jgi:hypothetical protein